MEIKVDMTAVDSLLEAGTYDLVLESVENKVSKSGNPTLACTFKVEGTDRKLFESFSLQQQALFKLRDFLVAANVELKPDGFDTLELLGVRVKANIVTKTYEGKDRNQISSYLRAE